MSFTEIKSRGSQGWFLLEAPGKKKKIHSLPLPASGGCQPHSHSHLTISSGVSSLSTSFLQGCLWLHWGPTKILQDCLSSSWSWTSSPLPSPFCHTKYHSQVRVRPGPLCVLSRVQLFATPWSVACQAPLSMDYSRQEYWSGLSFPPPGDLPYPRLLHWQADSLLLETPGKPQYYYVEHQRQRENLQNIQGIHKDYI